jgi:hypothetical protein
VCPRAGGHGGEENRIPASGNRTQFFQPVANEVTILRVIPAQQEETLFVSKVSEGNCYKVSRFKCFVIVYKYSLQILMDQHNDFARM